MNRRVVTIAAVLAVAVLLGLATWRSLTAGVTPGQLVLAGDVRSDVRAVQAPAIVYPVPDYSVGIPKPASASALGGGGGAGTGGGARPAAGAGQRSSQPTISGVLDAVYVRQGDRVKAGQKIAQLNTELLALGVKQAKTKAARTRADIGVIDKNLDTVADNQSKLADARVKLADASRKLATAEKTLAAGEALLTANRAKILAGIQQLEGVINGPHPPGPWPPPAVVAQLQQLKMALAALDAAAAQLPAGKAALATGKAQIASGKAQLVTGAQKLADAKKLLKKARRVMKEVAKGDDVLVELAKFRLTQATVVAPVDGIVVDARKSGTVAMVNAPLAQIRPDAPTEVETYLTGDQLGMVSVGSSATVDFDSNQRGPIPGTVSYISSTAEFPPTAFPTNVVHMTQTVKIRVRLDKGGWAPPGTPVDVRIKIDSAR